jgi:transcriptional regulator
MHINPIHAETRIRALRKLIRDCPLGVLTTAILSAAHPLILSSHIPWVLDVQDEGSETELGRLRGHLARANPQSKVMIASLTCPDSKSNGTNVLEQEVSILFTHPMNGYITPKLGDR